MPNTSDMNYEIFLNRLDEINIEGFDDKNRCFVMISTV